MTSLLTSLKTSDKLKYSHEDGDKPYLVHRPFFEDCSDVQGSTGEEKKHPSQKLKLTSMTQIHIWPKITHISFVKQSLSQVSATCQFCLRSALPSKFVKGQPYWPSLSKVSPTCQVCQRSALPAKFVIGQPYLPILAKVCTTFQVCQRSALPAKFVKGQPYLPSLSKVHTCQICQRSALPARKVSPTCQVCQRSALPAKFAKGQPYLPSLSSLLPGSLSISSKLRNCPSRSSITNCNRP